MNLGTGGSDLGPRLVADALAGGREAGTLEVRFAANVDPRDLERALEGADPASTLFVVVSKTFTTQETMANAEAAKALAGIPKDPGSLRGGHGKTSPGEAPSAPAEVLPMWDWVGGRFSVWSAVGLRRAVRHRRRMHFEELLARRART